MLSKRIEQMVKMGLLAALSIILVYLIHFPIFPAAQHLEFDIANVPILIGTFMFGPIAGLCLTAVVSMLQWLLISPQSGWVGAVMHFCATGGLVLVAGLIYRAHKTRKGAVVALILGSLTLIALMVPLNYFFTVRFWGTPYEVVDSMMLPVIIPFNAIKAFGNAAITFLLYKSAAKVLRIERKSEEKPEATDSAGEEQNREADAWNHD